MAFSKLLRRGASSAAPSAIRALATASVRPAPPHHSLVRTISKREAPWGATCPSSFFLGRRLSTAAAAARKHGGDAELIKVIDHEIKCAEESDDHDRVEEVPPAFPFEIHDEAGSSTITLKRNYDEEVVEVIVSMPSLVTGDEPEQQNDGEEGDGSDGEGSTEKPGQSSLPLIVNIRKPVGVTLEFCCTAYPDEVTIDSLSVKKDGESEEDFLAYEGPAFEDLDENLQRAFHKYLDLRGISALTTNFLHEYMINKDSREYLAWLNKLKQFIQQ